MSLEAESPMTPGQKISRFPKVPKKIVTSMESLGQAQSESDTRTSVSGENQKSPGGKPIKKPYGVLGPRRTTPQTMKRGTLYALITTPRLITQGNAELSALGPDQKESTTRPRDQSSCLDITTSHDKQAETGTFQQGDEVLGEEITYKLPENKGKA